LVGGWNDWVGDGRPWRPDVNAYVIKMHKRRWIPRNTKIFNKVYQMTTLYRDRINHGPHGSVMEPKPNEDADGRGDITADDANDADRRRSEKMLGRSFICVIHVICG
jgi:hypothetical protein